MEKNIELNDINTDEEIKKRRKQIEDKEEMIRMKKKEQYRVPANSFNWKFAQTEIEGLQKEISDLQDEIMKLQQQDPEIKKFINETQKDMGKNVRDILKKRIIVYGVTANQGQPTKKPEIKNEGIGIDD